jgi:predicted nicotinamide N-methyase
LALNHLPPLPYVTGNWGRVNAGLGQFDLLMASDVLYERDHPAQLSGFIQTHAAEGAEVIIIDPNRGNRSAFHRDMANMGFSVDEVMLTEPLENLSPYRGRLLHYTRH